MYQQFQMSQRPSGNTSLDFVRAYLGHQTRSTQDQIVQLLEARRTGQRRKMSRKDQALVLRWEILKAES